MRCCVPGCKNYLKNLSKSQGITFHAFPHIPNLRTAWLKAVGMESWTPKKRSVVCSEHFLAEDLYETKSGIRKVRSGAVPIALQNSSTCDYEETEEKTFKVCRICLTMESKMYSITKYKLEQAYENLTGVSISTEDKLPTEFCVECTHRLLSANKFRSKSLKAHALLTEIAEVHSNITLNDIKLINREKNELTTSLTCKYYETNHADLYIESNGNEHDKQTDGKTETPSIQEIDLDIDLDIKNEDPDEIFISENDYQETTVKNELDTIINHDDDDLTDGDYVLNADNPNLNDDDFSTDDSIPLEKRRTKKKVKRKREDKKVRKRQIKKKLEEPKIDRRRKPFLNDDLNETLFTITDLTFEEQVAEIIKRQDSANYKNALFKCTECFKGFLDEDAYNGHMTRHTNQCGEFRCDICKTHFKHPHALRKHITAHHTQRFSCNQCPYVTTHRQTARLHERWHKGTKYQCPHCQDEFVKFTTYMGHIRIKHPSDFVCQVCGFSFVSQKGIELHRKLKHRMDTVEVPEDGPYCELCNVKFVSMEAHKQHLRVSARHNTSDKDSREPNKPRQGRKSKEAKEREKRLKEKFSKETAERRVYPSQNRKADGPIPCEQVSYEKNSKETCERKVYPSQKRKADGPIPCEQCGLQLEDSRAYHGHFRRMHPDKNRTNYPSMKSPCMCEVCGRMFQSYALLKDHRWVHTGERPFKCDSCGKSFRMKQRLVAHRRVHSQEKASYLCNLCGKHFSTHSNRQRHMFIHTGLKPFKCEMCGKGFKHASEKRAHITYVHLKKPWPKRSRAKRRDGRQGSLPPQPIPTSASEMNIPPQLWPQCDQKLDHMSSVMDDKPLYYNLKI